MIRLSSTNRRHNINDIPSTMSHQPRTPSPFKSSQQSNKDIMSCLMTSKFHRKVLIFIPMALAVRALMFHSQFWASFATNGTDNNCSCSHSPAALQASFYQPRRQPGRSSSQSQQQQQQQGTRGSRPKTSLDNLLSSVHAHYAAQLQNTEMAIHTRAFPQRHYNASTFPCFEPDEQWQIFDKAQREPAQEGFFYVKTHKTASTTVMGISIRIAQKAAERHNQIYGTNFTPCKVRFEHWPAHLLDYGHRTKEKSFLFAIIREPTHRAVSMFFHFEVSRAKKEPTDSYFQNYLTALPEPDPFFPEYYPWGWTFDHYLHYLSPSGYAIGSGRNDPKVRVDAVNEIIDNYDFIGITERLDESLVALQMILGLKTSDILYSSAKGNGNWDDKGFYIQPSFVSEGMESFFASSTWAELSQGDYLMYLAANVSLDRTIDGLGRKQFDEKLQLFRYAKKLVLNNCTQIKPVYSAAGRMYNTDCLLADAGCGNACFDQLERDFAI